MPRLTVVTMLAGLVSLTFAAAAHAGWVLHEAPEFGFTALFPTAPKSETTTDNGVKMTGFSAVVDGAMCIVMAADYPYVVNADEETAASRDNFAKGVSATVSTSKRTKFARGTTVLEALEFDAASDTYSFRSIIIIEGARVYMVAGGVPKPDGDTAELEACVRGFGLTAKN